MARVELHPLFKGINKSLGDYVFYSINGKTFIRRKGTIKAPQSESQKISCEAFAATVKLWKELNGIVRSGWNEFARGQNFTGYNAFIAANVPLVREGKPLELTKPLGEEPLTAFTAAPGAVAGEIACTFAGNGSRKHVTIFAHSVQRGEDTTFRRFDVGADTATHFTLDGLIPGMEYNCYAVVTDQAYSVAVTVSAALTATCYAGE